MGRQSRIHFSSHHRSFGLREAVGSIGQESPATSRSHKLGPRMRGNGQLCPLWVRGGAIPRSGKTISRGSFIPFSAAQTNPNTLAVLRLCRSFVKHTFTVILRVGLPHVHLGVCF